MTSTIKKFSHIFTQNQESIDLLKKINYSNFSLSGDTRFDRVSNQLVTKIPLILLKNLKMKSCVLFLVVHGEKMPNCLLNLSINTTIQIYNCAT